MIWGDLSSRNVLAATRLLPTIAELIRRRVVSHSQQQSLILRSVMRCVRSTPFVPPELVAPIAAAANHPRSDEDRDACRRAGAD
jgi:hypothetical protein